MESRTASSTMQTCGTGTFLPGRTVGGRTFRLLCSKAFFKIHIHSKLLCLSCSHLHQHLCIEIPVIPRIFRIPVQSLLMILYRLFPSNVCTGTTNYYIVCTLVMPVLEPPIKSITTTGGNTRIYFCMKCLTSYQTT